MKKDDLRLPNHQCGVLLVKSAGTCTDEDQYDNYCHQLDAPVYQKHSSGNG